MAGFLIDPTKGETPESVAAQRAVADALAQRALSGPRNVGEGLTAVGNAIAYRALMRRAAAAQAAGEGTLSGPAANVEADLRRLLMGEGATADVGTPPAVASPAAAPPTAPDLGTSGVSIGGGMAGMPTRPPSAGAVANVPTGWTAGAPAAQPTYANLGDFATNLDPQFASPLNKAIADATAATGQKLGITEGYRDAKTQAQYYANYTGKPVTYGGVTYTPQKQGGLAAPPGQSYHQYGEAVDLASGPGLDWLHQNIGKYPDLAFLPGAAGAQDPVHIQYAGGKPVTADAGATGAVPQASSTGLGGLSPDALTILGSKWATEQQRSIAKLLLDIQTKRADPTYALDLATKQAQLSQLQHPKAETASEGGILYERGADGQWKAVTPMPGPEWRDATPDEIAAMHLSPGTPLQVNTRTGQKAVPSGLGGGLAGLPGQDDVTSIADSIARGDTPPTQISRNSRYNAPVIAELGRRGVDLAQLTTDWNATQRHYATLNNPQQTRIRQNIDTLQHTLPTIRSLAEQWNAGGFPILNAANRKLALEGVYGPEANKIVTLLGQQTADVVGEISSVLMGGNAPTDHAMELAAQNLSADWSYPTMIAALDQLERNITFRRNAIENVSTAGVADSKYNYQQTDATVPSPAEPPATPAVVTPPAVPGNVDIDTLIKKYAP